MRLCTTVMTLLVMAAASRAAAQPGDVRLPRVFVEVEASADLDSSADWQAAGVGVRLTVPLPSGLTPQLDRLMQVLNARAGPGMDRDAGAVALRWERLAPMASSS